MDEYPKYIFEYHEYPNSVNLMMKGRKTRDVTVHKSVGLEILIVPAYIDVSTRRLY